MSTVCTKKVERSVTGTPGYVYIYKHTIGNVVHERHVVFAAKGILCQINFRDSVHISNICCRLTISINKNINEIYDLPDVLGLPATHARPASAECSNHRQPQPDEANNLK